MRKAVSIALLRGLVLHSSAKHHPQPVQTALWKIRQLWPLTRLSGDDRMSRSLTVVRTPPKFLVKFLREGESMTPSKTASCRPVSPLNSKLERQLTAYGAVAGAACLGILATPQLTQAEIVYTSANISITGRDSVALDLNQDGIADFELVTRFCGSHCICFLAALR